MVSGIPQGLASTTTLTALLTTAQHVLPKWYPPPVGVNERGRAVEPNANDVT